MHLCSRSQCQLIFRPHVGCPLLREALRTGTLRVSLQLRLPSPPPPRFPAPACLLGRTELALPEGWRRVCSLAPKSLTVPPSLGPAGTSSLLGREGHTWTHGCWPSSPGHAVSSPRDTRRPARCWVLTSYSDATRCGEAAPWPRGGGRPCALRQVASPLWAQFTYLCNGILTGVPVSWGCYER